MQKIWQIKKIDKILQRQFSRELKISPVTAQLLVNRGIKDINEAEAL